MTIQIKLMLPAVVGMMITIVFSYLHSSVFAQVDGGNTTDSSQNAEEINVLIQSRSDAVSLAYRLVPVIAIAAAVVGFIIWKQCHKKL